MAKPNSTKLLDETLAQLLSQGQIKTIYDIGANKGDWTSSYSKKIAGAEFHMFEANTSIQKPIGCGHWHQIALGKENGAKKDFFVSPFFEGAGNSFYRENSELYQNKDQKIKLVTYELDSYVEEKRLRMPDFIKIDTQGSELDILSGSSKCLNHCSVIMSEVPIVQYNEGAPSLPEYISFMKSHSLVPVGIEEIHILDSILVQIDIVFVKEISVKRYLKPVNPIGWSLNINW